MNDPLRLACPLAILAAVLLPATAYPGDEDANPAYMIYIDPETGKYTTEDPDADTYIVVPANAALSDDPPGLPYLVVGGALAILLVVGLVKYQRRRLT